MYWNVVFCKIVTKEWFATKLDIFKAHLDLLVYDWSISCWQNSYNSVFFPKAEWWVFLNDKNNLQLFQKKLFGTWQFDKIGVLVNLKICKIEK